MRVSIVLGLIGLAAAWPHQTQEEIEAEAARDAAIYKEMMKYDIFGRPRQAAEHTKSGDNKDGCPQCPAGEYFQACKTAGMAESYPYSCMSAYNYLVSRSQCGDYKDSLQASCCSSSPVPPTEDQPDSTGKCPVDKGMNAGPACSPLEQSVECTKGYRPSKECVVPFQWKGKMYDSCIQGNFQTWCSHDAVYKGDYSTCEICIENVNSDHKLQRWLPAMQTIRCLHALATSGDASQRIITFENADPDKGSGFDTLFPAFSAGKFPVTVMFGGLINDGHLRWDMKASEVFDWWTKDSNDPRSRVTVSHLMSFTDGFVNIEGITQFTHDVVKQRCLTPGIANFYTPEQCAQQIYDTAKFAGATIGTYMNETNPGAEPGTYFEYNSYHQQIVLGMATKVTGLDARDLLKKYIFEPAGMTKSYWLGGQNPTMSAFLQTTADDYDSFLRAHAGYKLIPKSIADVTETVVFKKGGKVKNFASQPMIEFDNFAMGLVDSDGLIGMGGNIGNAINRETGHYSMIASSGFMPYQFSVLMQVYNFHRAVEEVWNGTLKESIVV